MKITKKQFVAAAHPQCSYGTREEVRAAIDARFPGTEELDLAALIQSWLDDRSLSRATLTACATQARKLAKAPVGGAYLAPRKCLETVLQRLQQPTEETDAGR